MKKIKGIIKINELGLPTPPTIFISDINTQLNELNNFLSNRDYVMVRSDSKEQSTHCPSKLKCNAYEAKDFVKELNDKGFVAIVQSYIPLNNQYSGCALILNNSIIIESMKGGPGSKLTREGIVHQHLRINKQGSIIKKHGIDVIPKKEIEMIINRLKDLPVKNHLITFSRGPDWFYFWDAQKDNTSELLE